MKIENNTAGDIVIGYIGGGSKGWAWGLMSDLAAEKALSGTVRLYDIDSKSALDNEIIGNKYADAPGAAAKWRYKAVPSLKECLCGADFVVISILPATLDEMYCDVHIPEKYGVYQSVGDTVGPGGLFRSFRTVPMYKVIAEAIRDYAPDAWVINYTNPMSVCTKTLYEVFPDIKAFGCCHEVFGTQKLLASMVSHERGLAPIKRTDIKINVFGINHFTWIDKAEYEGENIVPMFYDFARKYYDTGFETEKDAWKKDVYKYANRVKFDLSLRYNLVSAAGCRHAAEFVGDYYLNSPEIIEGWKFRLTPVDFRKEEYREREAHRDFLLRTPGSKYVLEATGEDGVRQIKALLGLQDLMTNVNLPNKGQIPSLPENSIVETNAYFTRNSITPLFAGSMPESVNRITLVHIKNQEGAVKAALQGDRGLALEVLLNDPLIADMAKEEACKLFKEMYKATEEYLPF